MNWNLYTIGALFLLAFVLFSVFQRALMRPLKIAVMALGVLFLLFGVVTCVVVMMLALAPFIAMVLFLGLGAWLVFVALDMEKPKPLDLGRVQDWKEK